MDRGRKRIDGTPRDLTARLDGRVIEVTGPALRPIGRHLAAKNGIISFAQVGARLRVLVSDNIDTPEVWVREALGSPSDVSARPVRANLEDVFVLATKETEA